MLDLYDLPSRTKANVQVFVGRSNVAVESWEPWIKPRGCSMANIILIGKGGNGGVGAIGANSTAAGGGGGGSGGQTILNIPLSLLPDILYLSLSGPGTVATASYISAVPGSAAVGNQFIAAVNAGGNGGNAAGATAGAAGTAGAIATNSSMVLGFAFAQVLAGQAGIIGGVAVAGAALSLPTTGLLVTGGTGGGGLPAAAAVGVNGGQILGAGVISNIPGGVGGSVATTPPALGQNGYRPIPGSIFGLGGVGGGSTHGTATTTGLVQGSGSNGAPGCGGGGSGGALTGSTAGVVGLGGPAFCIITCW